MAWHRKFYDRIAKFFAGLKKYTSKEKLARVGTCTPWEGRFEKIYIQKKNTKLGVHLIAFPF